jgi:hypothetical protein
VPDPVNIVTSRKNSVVIYGDDGQPVFTSKVSNAKTMNSVKAAVMDGFDAPVAKAPAAAAEAKPAKPGFFRRLANAINPFHWPEAVAQKSKSLSRFLGWTTAAGSGASALATGAFVAKHFVPQAVHGALHSLGLVGLMGPQGAALVGAALFGVATIAGISLAVKFLRAGREPKVDKAADA